MVKKVKFDTHSLMHITHSKEKPYKIRQDNITLGMTFGVDIVL